MEHCVRGGNPNSGSKVVCDNCCIAARRGIHPPRAVPAAGHEECISVWFPIIHFPIFRSAIVR